MPVDTRNNYFNLVKLYCRRKEKIGGNEVIMKKNMIIISTIILVLLLAACNTNNLEEYKKASEKTEQIKKGNSSGEFSLNMNFNTEGLSAEKIKNLNYYKDMKGSFNVSFDEESEKSIFRNYLNFGGLGFDFDIYANGDEMFMKLPVIGKYMNFDQIQKSFDANEETIKKEIISEETLQAIMKKQLELLNEEDVFKGKDIILTTPDGEVKTTEYTITLSDAQIKTLVSESIEIASKDSNLKDFYETYIKKNIENSDSKTFEEIIKHIKDNIDNYNVDDFKYTALVDIDGYIVSENIKFSIKTTDDKLIFEGMDYNLDIKNWNINKEQDFDFPVLTEENTIKVDDVDENMPNMIEDLFRTKSMGGQ